MSGGECVTMTLPSVIAQRLTEELREAEALQWRALGRTVVAQLTAGETVTLRLSLADHADVLCCLFDMASDFSNGHMHDGRFTAEEMESAFLTILRGLRPAEGGV